MKTLTSLALTLLAVAGWAAQASAQTAESLLGRIPEAANFVAVVNNRAILNTPRAVREGWSKMNEIEYLEDAIPIPPTVPLVVMGSQIDPGDLTGNWALGVFSLNQRMSMKQLVDRYGGRVEMFGDWRVAVTPRGYIIEMLDNVYGLMINGSRQDFSRWVKNFTQSRKPLVNEYLKQVVADSKSAHVAVAFDLEDSVEPASLHTRLSLFKSLSGKSPAEVAALEKVLVSLKGLRITVKIGEKAKTTLRIDFKKEIGAAKDLLKPAIMDFVNSMGASIEEFEAGDWKYETNAIVVQADLSDGSLARLMTVALMPMQATDPNVAPSAANVQAEMELIATRRYYRAIALLINDLEKEHKKTSDYTKTAMWHENFAAKINQLPQANVDSAMLQYGYATATNLRTIAQSLRGVPVKVYTAALGLDIRVTASQAGYQRVYYRGWRTVPITGYMASSNSADILLKQGEIIAADALERDKVWSAMGEDRRRIRGLMYEKYKVDFDAVK